MRKVIALVFIFQLLMTNILLCQIDYANTNTILIDSLISNDLNLRKVRNNTAKYKLQIIYTKVLHKEHNKPQFQNYSYNLSNELYFYPASLVKLPESIFTLEKLNKLKSLGVGIDSRIAIESNYSCQSEVVSDKLSDNLVPTLRNYIVKALIVSDNESYNRLYEFVGQEYANNRMAELGYEKSRILNRFSLCDTTENRYTNGFKFFNSNDDLIYYQQPAVSKILLSPPLSDMKLGIAHLYKGKIVQGPRDFSYLNFMPLANIHDLLIRLVYPVVYPDTLRITKDDRLFLLESLVAKPCECSIRKIADDKSFYDHYTNYLYYGSDRKIVENKALKIYNIVGQSYGFLADVAYFQDDTNNVVFFLSAVIYTNSSEIIGNNGYEYDSVGFPFLRDLGKCIYNYEISNGKN